MLTCYYAIHSIYLLFYICLNFNIWGVGCVFSDEDQVNGEKQVRVSEDTPTGTQIFVIKAFPRRLFAIQSLDGVSLQNNDSVSQFTWQHLFHIKYCSLYAYSISYIGDYINTMKTTLYIIFDFHQSFKQQRHIKICFLGIKTLLIKSRLHCIDICYVL